MSQEFPRDNKWAWRTAMRFLDPLYFRRGWQVQRCFVDEMQRKHVDVVLTKGDEQHRIDEKIIRGRRDGLPAAKINYETMSCTIAGFEKSGWGARDEDNQSTIILIAFADLPDLDPGSWSRVRTLDCVWIPFPPLREWFWRMDGERRWERQHNKQRNGSISHKVPIAEILAEFADAARFTLYADGVVHRIAPAMRIVA